MANRKPVRADGVLCVGRVYTDLIFTGLEQLPVLGEEHFASGLSIQVGGGAYISASFFAWLKRPVSLLATLPSGPFANTVYSELSDSGINIDHCQTSHIKDDHQLTVALSMGAERAFITKRNESALPVKKIDWHNYPQIGHLHIGELATLIDYPNLVDDAHSFGVSVSLDCSWDAALLERKDLGKYLQNVDIFLPNRAEFEQLQKVCAVSESIPLIVVKTGSNGAIAYVKGRSITTPAIEVDVVDTTGAGDAFNAGFIHGWLSNHDLEQCLELGNRCGAKSVSQVGGAISLTS